MAEDLQQLEPSRSSRITPRVIAVDGSAAAGKSTIGKRLAAKLGYPFLDTGIMYRAITYAALQRGVDLDDHDALTQLARSVRLDVAPARPGDADGSSISVDGEAITDQLRTPAVEENVSLVSRVSGVREAMVDHQRLIAGQQPIVMAGRDIGTVVLPGADLKIYLDASLTERARRRHQEFERLGRAVNEADVLADIERRDQIDQGRSVSPLRPADDAIVINTDGLSQDAVFAEVLKLVALDE